MSVKNLAMAAIFDEIGDRLAIQGANVFRIRAYRNAARTLQELTDDVGRMIERGDDLTKLPGIGADLAGKISEIAKTARAPCSNACATRCRRPSPSCSRCPDSDRSA